MAYNLPSADFVTSILSGSLTAIQTTATIGTGLAIAAANGVLQIDYDSLNAVGIGSGPETIIYGAYDASTGNLTGITRGAAGTVGVTHANAAHVQAGNSVLLVQPQVSGWQALATALTYSPAQTAITATDQTATVQVGDKMSVLQSVPLTSYFPLVANSTDTKSGYNGTDTDVTYTAGKFGNSATFNGSSSKIVISDTANLKPTGAFSKSFWVKGGGSGDRTIYQSKSKNTNWAGYDLLINSSGNLLFETGNNTITTPSVITGSTTIDTNLHLVVIEWQSNFGKIFLDGQLEASGYMVVPAYAATNYIRIGCGNESGTDINFFNGQITDLAIINGFAVDSAWALATFTANVALTNANITPTQYFNVQAITSTILTLNGGADYVLYNGAITSPYYSKSNAVGFPGSFNLSMATTGWTPAPAQTSKLIINGRLVKIPFSLNGTSSATTATMTLPIMPVSINSYLFVSGLDNGTAIAQPCEADLGLTTTVTFNKVFGSSGGWTASGNKIIMGTIEYLI